MDERSFRLEVDGEHLACLHTPAEGDRAIVMIHGFTGDKHSNGTFDRIAERFAAAGYNAIRFDCRGWGDSARRTDTFSVSSEVADLKAVVQHARGTYGTVGVLGFSMGAAIVAAADIDACAYALWSPAFRLPHLADGHIMPNAVEEDEDAVKTRLWGGTYRFGQRFLDELRSYDRDDLVSGISVPTLLVHGEDDESVPPSEVVEAEQRFTVPHRRVTLGGGHHLASSFDAACSETLDWFDTHCGDAS